MARPCPPPGRHSEVFSCTRSGLGAGLAGSLLEKCEAEARKASFRALELVATPMGEPLYAGFGFEVTERPEFRFPDGVVAPAARMLKPLRGAQDRLLQREASKSCRAWVAQRLTTNRACLELNQRDS
jgi:hypothetical protein